MLAMCRQPICFIISFFVATCLFLFMSWATMSRSTPLEKRPKLQNVEFIQLKRPERRIQKQDRVLVSQEQVKPEPVPVAEQPEPKPKKRRREPKRVAKTVPRKAPPKLVKPSVASTKHATPVAAKGTLTKTKQKKARSRLSPLVRVEPHYPSKAMRRGIEGWIKVVFTVNNAGRVANVQVLAAQPPRIFDQAAIRAVRQWRFKPTTIDGYAVSNRAMQLFTFNLRKG